MEKIPGNLLPAIKNNEYFAYIVNKNGKTIENKNITEDEIKKVYL